MSDHKDTLPTHNNLDDTLNHQVDNVVDESQEPIPNLLKDVKMVRVAEELSTNAQPIGERDGATQPLHDEEENQVMRFIARCISFIFSPLLVPTYGILIAFNLSYIAAMSSLNTRLIASSVIFILTCAVPGLYIWNLYTRGKLSDIGVNNQSERLKPYIVTILTYTISMVYLSQISTPRWVIGFLVGGGAAAITSALINIKWKISAHGAAMGGLVALVMSMWTSGYVLFDFTPVVSLVILFAGLVCTSRLILRHHTLGQVAAGTLNGFMWVYFLSIITN